MPGSRGLVTTEKAVRVYLARLPDDAPPGQWAYGCFHAATGALLARTSAAPAVARRILGAGFDGPALLGLVVERMAWGLRGTLSIVVPAARVRAFAQETTRAVLDDGAPVALAVGPVYRYLADFECRHLECEAARLLSALARGEAVRSSAAEAVEALTRNET